MYNEDTSMDANRQFVGIGVDSINLINSVESFIYEGSFFDKWLEPSVTMKLDMDSVMLLQLDTIGRIPIGFL